MLVNTKDIKTEGSLGGRKIAMSLDANSLVHLMSVLSDLYSDPAGAVIREYTTNALDSHIASGQTRPVELFTPSRLSPYFVVRDFGVGMSEDDIENIYSQFGNSTKRTNNDEAGMLGLGSKSALTFTEQFNLITVKDGIKLLVSVSRSADGSGGLEIVSKSATDEPNGVTIKIPVQRDIHEFNKKVNEFARFVAPGKITVDGNKVDRNLKFVSEKVAVYAKDRYNNVRDRIVMGNVSYPTNTQLLQNYVVVYFADMGKIDFTPSREELMYTSVTKATLDEMKLELQKNLPRWLRESIEEADTIREAWSLRNELAREFYGYTIPDQYKGVTLPDRTIMVNVASWPMHVDGPHGKCNYGQTGMNRIESDLVVVTGWDNAKFTRTQARKINAFLQSKGVDVRRIVLEGKLPHPELFKGLKHFTWQDIKKYRTGTPKPKGAPRKPRTWEGVGGSGSHIHFDMRTPDVSNTIYFGAKSLVSDRGLHRQVIDNDTEFYYVTDSEKERFLKQYPTAKHISEYFKTTVQEYLTNLTAEDYEYFEYAEAGSRNDYMLDWTKINDPVIAKIVKYAKSTTGDAASRYQKAKAAWNTLPWNERKNFVFPEFKDSTDYDSEWDKYPLLTEGSFYGYASKAQQIADHLHKYINAIYAEIHEEKE